jgi:hypothetical protein
MLCSAAPSRTICASTSPTGMRRFRPGSAISLRLRNWQRVRASKAGLRSNTRYRRPRLSSSVSTRMSLNWPRFAKSLGRRWTLRSNVRRHLQCARRFSLPTRLRAVCSARRPHPGQFARLLHPLGCVDSAREARYRCGYGIGSGYARARLDCGQIHATAGRD